jgi:type IVB pilus formation R64 PilN family outer membrane protein
MGSAVPVAAAPSPSLARRITYKPRQSVSLNDVTTFITQTLGLTVDTSEVQSTPALPATAGAQAGSPVVPALTATGGAPAPRLTAASSGLTIDYDGELTGLLDILASKTASWWKLSADGRGVVFYRTETRTFYLPALPNKTRGSSQIAANSTSSNGSGSGSSGGSSSGGGANNASLIGASTTTDFEVDMWGDLERTAKTVGGGAQVAVSPSLGSVTVTGNPTQVRAVEEWAKGVADNLSQQVAITVDVYVLKGDAEDNYGWNPSVLFSSLSGRYGLTLTSPDVPAVVSGTSPLNLTASVLSTATGRLSQFAGSEFTLNALSTKGKVVQTMHQTVVTLNGRPVPLQVADVKGYLAAQTPSASVALGATPLPPTLTPGTLTTGFTAVFTPKLVNGRVLLAMDITHSNDNGFGKAGTDESFIQTPNYSLGTFQQSASLNPGDSLLLTGVQKYSGQSKRSGVGSPDVFVAGGGIDDTSDRLLTAIVVTAKVLQ